jgi:O-antigen/teichoic acid export membrane protein
LAIVAATGLALTAAVSVIAVLVDARAWFGIGPACLVVLPISFLGAGVYLALNSWAIRMGRFSQIAQTRLAQGIGLVAAQLGLGLLGAGPLGLLLGDAIGRVTGSLSLAKRAWREDRAALRQVSRRGMRRVARHYVRFPLFSSGAALINNSSMSLPVLILSFKYGVEVVGLYALGSQVLGKPLQMIASAVAQVFVRDAAVAFRSTPDRLMPTFFRTLRALSLVGIPLVLGLALVAPRLFPIVFGDRWRDSGLYLSILAPMFLAQLLASPTGSVLDVLQRQGLHLVREILRLALTAGAVLAATATDASPTGAVIVFSAAGTVSYLIHLLLSYLSLRRWEHERNALPLVSAPVAGAGVAIAAAGG